MLAKYFNYRPSLLVMEKGVWKFKALKFWYLIMYIFITYIQIIFQIHDQGDYSC